MERKARSASSATKSSLRTTWPVTSAVSMVIRRQGRYCWPRYTTVGTAWEDVGESGEGGMRTVTRLRRVRRRMRGRARRRRRKASRRLPQLEGKDLPRGGANCAITAEMMKQ